MLPEPILNIERHDGDVLGVVGVANGPLDGEEMAGLTGDFASITNDYERRSRVGDGDEEKSNDDELRERETKNEARRPHVDEQEGPTSRLGPE